MKNVALVTLVAAASLSVACESPLSPEDKSKEKAQISVLALVGVGVLQSASASAIAGSCNVSPSSGCMDYYTGWSTAQMQSDCTAASGAFTAGSAGCSSASRVGSCLFTNRGFTTNTGATSVLRFYGPAHTTGSAQTGCVGSSGTFTAN